MKKEKIILCFVIIGIILALSVFAKLRAIIYAASVVLLVMTYFKLIKISDQFQNFKSILIAAGIVGLAFAMILPNTSKDVFFYMGSGRAFDRYDINPYTTSIAEIDDVEASDYIIKAVGNQSVYTFVYGPIFLTICGLLSKISFSSLIVFLYEFKILNLITYLITVYLVYLLTKKKKLTIAYAFNPLVLLEVLVNVHNDIFALLFAFLGIFFIKEAEKCRESLGKSELSFICGLICLVLSACVKYVAIIILPFVILYRLRNEKMWKKIILGMVYLLVFFGMFGVMYMPYFDNPLNCFTGAIAQSGKLKDSIYLIIAMITERNSKIVSIAYSIGFFVLLYVVIIKILMQAFRKNTFKAMMENSYIVLFSLIFLGLTNLTSWYLLWLLIPVFWTSGSKLKNWIWMRIFI